MGWFGLLIVVLIIYQLVKPKGPKVRKMSAFDAYLIEHHKKSQVEANKIPTIVPNINITMEHPKIKEDSTQVESNLSWTDDLYLGMLKAGNCPDENGLRREAMEAMYITETELDELLSNYTINKRKTK